MTARPSGGREPSALDNTSSNVEQLAAALAPMIAEQVANARADALLDAKGAGRLLNVPASWVLAEARADRIPHVRLGRYVRFRRDELTAWASARARGPRVRTGSLPVSNGSGSP